jgi:catechol 2,3-dioxygenase-like lactoylglutathione lyase family enzyme
MKQVQFTVYRPVSVPMDWILIWLLLALVFVSSAHSTGLQPISAAAPARFERRPNGPLVTAVDAVGITVSDMDQAVDFYSRVLSFRKVSEVEVEGEHYERLQGLFGLRMLVVRMALGDEVIELTEYLAPGGRPIPADSRSNDLWFQHVAIIVRDMDRAYEWLRKNEVRHASSGPQRIPDWNTSAAGIKAFYFKDPDGHTLEILSFPAGKGNEKWHRPGTDLFLGIDHTAIAVSDTEASLRFYKDTLGFTVGGESENYGTEQEHLNNVFGARLRITSLHAAEGPSIEFLEYVTPRDGRKIPSDLRPSDIAHWQTRLRTDDALSAAKTLIANRFLLVSPGVVELSDRLLGFERGLHVNDPDGHVMELVQR